METLLLPFSPRFIVLTICAVVTALLIAVGLFDHNPKIWEILLIPIGIFGALTVLGIRDLTQKGHAVLRNYPISAHIRFLLEEIRPEMRQYFFESEKDGMISVLPSFQLQRPNRPMSSVTACSALMT